MSIQERVVNGRKRWDVRYRAEGRHRSRTFGRKRDAEAFEAEWRLRAKLGAHAQSEPSPMTLREWLGRWWDAESVAWARSTKRQRGSVLDRWIVPYLGDARLRDLGTARVNAWRAEVVRVGAPPTQANQALRVLSAALGCAVRDGLVPANPCGGVRRVPVAPSRPRALLPDEAEAIRAHLPTARDRAAWSLMAYAGLRPGEVAALTWGSVGERVLIIDRSFTDGEERGSKTNRRRTVEMVGPLADDLAALVRHAPDELVIRGERGARFGVHNWTARVFGPAREAAGVECVPYDGRHTYASLLIHEGRSLPYVTAALGHASPTTTLNHYAHLFDDARHAPGVPLTESVYAARARALKLSNRSRGDGCRSAWASVGGAGGS